MARTREGGGALKCSFCGKSQNDVRKLIAGPTVYICDECIELCNDIIAEEWEEEKSRELRSLPKPSEIKNVLDQYVVGQEDPRGRGPQPLQAHRGRLRGGGGGAAEGQHPADRPHRLRQDPPRPDPRQDAPRALHHRRRHDIDRGRLRRRGRREYYSASAAGGGL